MKVLVKKNPPEPMVTARAAKTMFRQWLRSTSRTGLSLVWSLSLTSANSGDSGTPKRISKPTIISSPLIRNGIRQPQLIRSSVSIAVMKRKAISASSRPAGLPHWANEAKNTLRPLGACSLAISTAPPHSPPTEMPCSRRRNIRPMGAQIPACA
ncbi:hypothetical protein D3C80_947580 [compost metagenome]